jgi:UV DNA damage endonuclease
LDRTAKIQIHVGGVYGDRAGSIQRFIDRFGCLDAAVRDRLVVENDEKSYTLRDCLTVHEGTGLPVLFDVFHHSILNHAEDLRTCLDRASRTWRVEDGVPMVDYSTQAAGKPVGSHTASIDIEDFRAFLAHSRPHDLDIMLEIKDKEASAEKAIAIARKDKRLAAFDDSETAPMPTC